ncbi:MAG: hypothetical protein AB7O86_05865 [Porticoccaceae bacterium]
MVNLTDAQMSYLVPIAGTLIPLLVALVTTRLANARVKAFLNQFLTLLAATITAATVSKSFNVKTVAINFGIAYLTSEVVYENVWKRYGVAQYVARLFPERGITNLPLTRNPQPYDFGTALSNALKAAGADSVKVTQLSPDQAIRMFGGLDFGDGPDAHEHHAYPLSLADMDLTDPASDFGRSRPTVYDEDDTTTLPECGQS